MPVDALEGWDDELNAELYAQFTRDYPFYTDTSRDLASRADLSHARLVVDLCGGTGSTASVLLESLPPQGRVLSLDSAPAMQTIGRHHRNDPRITWVTAEAADIAEHITEPVDAVVCNSAIWKTDTPAVFTAVKQILRPGGRFVFNIGGGFTDLSAPRDRGSRRTPSLNDLITAIAVRDYGYVPPDKEQSPPVLPRSVVDEQLTESGLTVLSSQVVTHQNTVAEKRAWLSIPVFARPPGQLTYQQRMEILQQAYAKVDTTQVRTTRWLVVVAQN